MQSFAPHRLEGTPYRLDSVLGEGAMGEVYLGEHVDLRRPAVIKLIKVKYVREEQVVGRMRREARIVARIRHDALVTVYDLGTAADGRTYIAMEYLEGTVLRRILQTRGAIPADEATRWMAQACDGLDVAHRAGVIHRDVKPENLFIAATGQLKVLDFGVAKPMHEGDRTSAQTAAGMVLGTPRYMAPEQATGRALSGATDVYAVGCVLFELLTGSPVFEANDTRDLLYHHMKTPPPTLSARARRSFDARLESVVARALEKDPAARFASAAELSAALRDLPVLRPNAPPRVATAPVDESPTLRVADPETIIERYDVHAKPTIRIDAPDYPARPPASSDERSDAAVTDRDEATRAIPTVNLVAGVSTTEHQPMAATAQTEALNPTGGLNAEVGTAAPERRPSPMRVLAMFAFLAVAAASVGLFVLRARTDGGAAHKVPEQGVVTPPVVTEMPKSAKEPAPIEPPNTMVAVPASSPTATASPMATAAVLAKPHGLPKAPAKPSVAVPAASSAYDRAKQLMAEADLDAAEREARAAVATHGNAARLLLGEILERKGKPALARDTYKKVLELDPNNAIARTRLAKLGG